MATASEKTEQLTEMALRGTLIAKDAAMNLRDLLENSSMMAFLAVKDCEKELDQIERQIDEKLPKAITRVGEAKARELLACLKFITDLERIGDLQWWVAQRLQSVRVPPKTRKQMQKIAEILEGMLAQIHQGFTDRDLELATAVLKSDSEIDLICRALFREYLQQRSNSQSVDVLLMTQALERAGDHAKNLAEELYHLIEGHSLRHSKKSSRASN
jgi:phosphate transport system protein